MSKTDGTGTDSRGDPRISGQGFGLVLAGPAGGMGEVYRARDNRLDREVALRILSAEFAGDPERLQRFAREAQTLAALNHPNIAHIYGLEDTGDGQALVMELVEGEDLAARVARGRCPSMTSSR